jgi:hypothetical protein
VLALTNPSARTAPNVPHEFIGLARLFCARIEAASKTASASALQIAADAHAIVQRRLTWRPEHFPYFERQWRQTIPDEGRIGLAIERGKRALIIAEFRLSLSSYEDTTWSEPIPERSVALMLWTFHLSTPAAVECKRLAIGTLGTHAIARRYQRGFDNSDRAIQTDISELALNFSRLLRSDGKTFTLACTSGFWVGAIDTVKISGMRDQRLLNVRSFLQ